jgi:hypothetical protein
VAILRGTSQGKVRFQCASFAKSFPDKQLGERLLGILSSPRFGGAHFGATKAARRAFCAQRRFHPHRLADPFRVGKIYK